MLVALRSLATRAFAAGPRRGLAILAMVAALPAAAGTAITVPALGSGFNYYQGSYSLGWSFTLNTPVTVTELGFYDDLQNGLTQSHPVGIYDKATQALLATVTVSPADPLDGFFRYAPLPVPLSLAPGPTYVVMALVGSESYLAYFSLDPLWTVDPALTYQQGAVNYANPAATTLLFPDTFTTVGGDFGPNFKFAAGAGPIASVSPASLGFAPQGVGTTSPAQAVTLSNIGSGPLAISGFTTTGDFAASSGCGATLSPGGSCQFQVTFTPLVAGTRTGTLVIADDAPGSPRGVSLSGTGSAASVPVVSVAGSVAFPPTQAGSVSSAIDVTVLNAGGASLVVRAAEVIGPEFAPARDTCTGATVAPGGSCIVTIVFLPPAEGDFRASLRLVSNAPDSPALVTLSGTGTPVPRGTLSVAPALDFPDQVSGTSSAPRLLTVVNAGNYPVTVSSVLASGDFSATSDCGRIAEGGACGVSVTFLPTATGPRSGTLVIRSDASNGEATVALSGRGTVVPAPVIRLSVTGISFGNRLMGMAGSAQAVTLENAGGADLSIAGIDVLGEFAVASGCAAVVAPGANCRLDVSFRPTIPGSRSGKFRVRSNAVSGSSAVDLEGIGCRLFSLVASRQATPLCQ